MITPRHGGGKEGSEGASGRRRGTDRGPGTPLIGLAGVDRGYRNY